MRLFNSREQWVSNIDLQRNRLRQKQRPLPRQITLLTGYQVSLSERLGIRHVKTVVYRTQANRTERVNRDLVQMIANYVNEQHDTWDQFLREFAYAIRTAVNETTGETAAE
ncbi:hypothetical protein TNCV_4951361 [Trichonephila clavipes]|nr:hypothetical protein TNCV_4951361 [Trichonephila clavipes]